MTAAAALDVLADPLQMDFVVHLRGESRAFEIEAFRVGVQVLELEMRLIREQEIVHGPEAALRSGAFGSFGRSQSVRMNRFQWEVAICEQDLTVKALEKKSHRRRRLLARGALEIPVFHYRDRSVRTAENVICGVDRVREIERMMSGHVISLYL